MSGVTGNNYIKSREDFEKLLIYIEKLIKPLRGFVSITPTGSYISNKEKKEFGDIDLILELNNYSTKKEAKKELIKYLTSFSDEIIKPFTSEKYKGKKYYNSGEIITISINKGNIEPAQVDFIISLNSEETKFKRNFLNLPAEKQGLLLGLTKVALLERSNLEKKKLLKDLNIDLDLSKCLSNQEIEFNCSSKEIQLRKITYKQDLLINNQYKEDNREILWKSQNWKDLTKIIDFIGFSNFDLGFKDLIKIVEIKIKCERSLKRIKGVFSSMISIKYGEMGKPKGTNKQKFLNMVSKMKINHVTGIVVGRFQPLTKVHLDIIKKISKENTDGIIFLVKGKKEDRRRNPFSLDIQKEIISSVIPNNIKIIIINTGFFIDELNYDYSDHNFVLYSGTDRVKEYERFKSYLINGNKLNIKEIERTEKDISASKVRNALINNDAEKFNEMVGEDLMGYYKLLRENIE